MELQKIQALNRESSERLTGDEYKAAFEDSKTGDAFRARIDEIENSPRTANRPAGSVREAAPAPAQDFSDDPSWADEAPAPRAAAPAQPAEAAPAPASDAPLLHEYQPVDKNGRPIGGKQVFRYKDQNDLIRQLTQAHMNATAALRTRRKEAALAELTDANIERRIKPPAEPRVLTPSEQLELQHRCEQLRAEGKHAEAARLELNAALGIDVTDLATQLRESQEKLYLAAVDAALSEFKLQCPEYVSRFKSNENAQTLILYIQRRGLDETSASSYQEAFEKMREHLVEVNAAPAHASPSIVKPAAAVSTEVPAPVVPRAVVPMATGLSNVDGSEFVESSAPVKDGGWTAEKIENLPSEQYRRLVRDPKIATTFDHILQEAEERKAARRRR